MSEEKEKSDMEIEDTLRQVGLEQLSKLLPLTRDHGPKKLVFYYIPTPRKGFRVEVEAQQLGSAQIRKLEALLTTKQRRGSAKTEIEPVSEGVTENE